MKRRVIYHYTGSEIAIIVLHWQRSLLETEIECWREMAGERGYDLMKWPRVILTLVLTTLLIRGRLALLA